MKYGLQLQVSFWVLPCGLQEQQAGVSYNVQFHKILSIKPGVMGFLVRLLDTTKSCGSYALVLGEVSADSSYLASCR